MGPHAKNLDHVFFLQNLVDEAMLDVDSAGYGAFEVPDQCFVGRRSSEGVDGENAQEPLDVGPKAGRRDFLCVLLRLLRVYERPAHHLSSVEHSETGVFMPSTIESASPGKLLR